jgi:hypothetical protein
LADTPAASKPGSRNRRNSWSVSLQAAAGQAWKSVLDIGNMEVINSHGQKLRLLAFPDVSDAVLEQTSLNLDAAPSGASVGPIT